MFELQRRTTPGTFEDTECTMRSMWRHIVESFVCFYESIKRELKIQPGTPEDKDEVNRR